MMKEHNVFKRISLLVFLLITVLSGLFIVITYLSATYFYNTSTELLNKDVAAHIAKFASPFEDGVINKRKADSVFYNAMVVSPSIEVYFLDTAGRVIYYEAPDSAIKQWQIPLKNIHKLIASKGEEYITSPDPKDPGRNKIFSAAEVYHHAEKLGYIYVILGSKAYSSVNELLFKTHAGTLAVEAFCIIIILSVIITVYYSRRLQRRYNAILDVLNQHRQGNFGARFLSPARDEFTPITTSFNNMAELLSQNIAQLKKAEEERKSFIANISHDLRTPLSIASGFTETVISQEDTIANGRKRREYLQLVLGKLKQVEKMVMQLFELSRMDAIDFTAHKEPFIFSEIAQEIATGFQMAAAGKHIQLQCIGCNESAWVTGDIKMLERVIQNLVENAVKNTPDGGRITIALERQNNQLTVAFENTGEPLPAALVDWINGDSTVSLLRERPLSKTGLGLAIVKRVLELHGSRLLVSVHPSSGNRFVFTLPVYQN